MGDLVVWNWGLPTFTLGTTNSSHKQLRSQLTDPGYHGLKVSHPQGNPWRHPGPTGAAQAQQDISCDSLKFIEAAQTEKEKTLYPKFINLPSKFRAASFLLVFFFLRGVVRFFHIENSRRTLALFCNFPHSFNLPGVKRVQRDLTSTQTKRP